MKNKSDKQFYIISAIIVIVLVILDQITKWQALTKLKPIKNTVVIKGFLDFTFVENRGAAFGILSGKRVFFILLTVVVAIGILYSFYKLPKTKEYNWLKCGLVLVLSGAIGNVIDRAVRGYVVDFLEVTFIKWPVFNLADIYVVVGACFILFLSLFVIKEEEKKEV
ncbi:MAG: signal peptidase II [Firmicutes bacterium]|nr:signal peptidase II [Bacillota bacterium]